jgi:N,N-dimethylformamidase
MLRVTGYADRWSARPGETVRFMVSARGAKPYTARVARVHCGDPNPGGPGYREEAMPCAIEGRHDGVEQPLHLGSWVEVPALDLGAAGGPVAFAATVWPTLTRGRQAVLSWRGGGGGGGAALTLGASPEGAFARLDTGTGEAAMVSAGAPLTERAWHDIACAFDPAAGRLRVGQAPRRTRLDLDEAASAEAPAPHGTVLAGLGAGAIAARREPAGAPPRSAHFNGKIERPRVLATADLGGVLAAQRRGDLAPPGGARVVSDWDFALGITGDVVADTGPGGWNGRCRNLPTRAVTGSRWTGETQRWTDAPAQWNAIHFHEDDVGDAGWLPSLSLTIPDHWPSGVYALHLECEGERDNIPFYVRAAEPGAEAKVAFLAPTFTYTVYGQFARPDRQALIRDRALAWGALPQSADGHPEYGLSTYNWHSDGSGVCYASMLRPMVDKRVNHIQAMDPSEGGSGTYWIAADSYITDMLDRAGIAYEALTDHDLHEEGAAALAPYSVVLTGQHPEAAGASCTSAATASTGRWCRTATGRGRWRCGAPRAASDSGPRSRASTTTPSTAPMAACGAGSHARRKRSSASASARRATTTATPTASPPASSIRASPSCAEASKTPPCRTPSSASAASWAAARPGTSWTGPTCGSARRATRWWSPPP